MESPQHPQNPVPIDDRPSTTTIKESSQAMLSIGKEITTLTDEAEVKITKFTTQLAKQAKSLEASADLTLEEFHEYIHEGTVWLDHLLTRLSKIADSTHTSLDTARVKAHLAGMNAKDTTERLRVRLEHFKNEIDALVKRTEKSTSARLTLLGTKVKDALDVIS